MTLAVVIFVGTLAAIATERVHRTKVALVGAVLMLVTQTIDQEQAIHAIDFNTIGLLLGMMLMVRITEGSGVYTWLAIRAGQLSNGRSAATVWSLAVTTAVLSAFLDNLTTVLLVVPMTFLLADALDIDPIPIVIIEVIASNVGGAATLIGDPPNILIAGATGLTFSAFLFNLAPIVIVTFVVVTGLLYAVFRRRLQIAPEAAARVQRLDARKAIEDMAELKRTVPVLGVTILLFFFHGQLHLEPATIALGGATVMLLVTRQTVEQALSGIEWAMLIFFIALFVLVGGLEEAGAIGTVVDGMTNLTGGDRTAELFAITWLSALGSGIVDNIPFTTAMIPVVKELNTSGDSAYWWALSLGACFGGNATLVAAAANVAAAGLSERAGHRITFMTFLRVGVPATLVSMLLASLYIAVRYV